MLRFEYTGLNTGKFHEEIIGAGISPTAVLSKNGTTYLVFQNLREVKTAILDEHEEVTGYDVTYEKRTKVRTIDHETGEEVVTETWEPYDGAALKASIQVIVDMHDSKPLPPQPTEQEVWKQQMEAGMAELAMQTAKNTLLKGDM